MGKKSEIRNFANYGGKLFLEKSETRNYVGSKKFFGQKNNYVITQITPNHQFVLPLV